jgi:hypothetical protein
MKHPRALRGVDAPLVPLARCGNNLSFASITTLAIVLLFWPVIDKAFGSVGRLWRPAKA